MWWLLILSAAAALGVLSVAVERTQASALWVSNQLAPRATYLERTALQVAVQWPKRVNVAFWPMLIVVVGLGFLHDVRLGLTAVVCLEICRLLLKPHAFRSLPFFLALMESNLSRRGADFARQRDVSRSEAAFGLAADIHKIIEGGAHAATTVPELGDMISLARSGGGTAPSTIRAPQQRESKPDHAPVNTDYQPERPFSQQVLMLASAMSDELDNWAEATFGQLDRMAEEVDWAAHVDDAVCVVTLHITIDLAMESSDYHLLFAAQRPTADTVLVVVFALYVTTYIATLLGREGHKANLADLPAKVANGLLVGRSTQERADLLRRAIDQFRSMLEVNAPNLRDWEDHLKLLIPGYLTDWSTADEKIKRGYARAFDSLLQWLLSVRRAKRNESDRTTGVASTSSQTNLMTRQDEN